MEKAQFGVKVPDDILGEVIDVIKRLKKNPFLTGTVKVARGKGSRWRIHKGRYRIPS